MSMVLLPVPRSGELGVLERLGEGPGDDRPPDGPGETASLQGELETGRGGMEPCSAAGGRPGGVDADARSGTAGSGLPDQTHQVGARGHLTAADARALGTVGGA